MNRTNVLLVIGLAFSACEVPSNGRDVAAIARAGSGCVCPAGQHCESFPDYPDLLFCVPASPPIVYVEVGQFCGYAPDESGRLTEFRCHLDAHCEAGVCVCNRYPGGPCGSFTCPPGTFCEIDVYGDAWCGTYVGECSGI